MIMVRVDVEVRVRVSKLIRVRLGSVRSSLGSYLIRVRAELEFGLMFDPNN